MIEKLDVDLDAIYQNLENIHALAPRAKVFSVVKANAYGLGAVAVSKHIADITDTFCVAIFEEGKELRLAGITKPILVLGYIPEEDVEAAVEFDLMPTVFTLQQAEQFERAAKKYEKKIGVHIAVDTGHSRIGFVPSEQAIADVEQIAGMQHVDIEGIFSHFSTADEEDRAFSELQYERFVSFLAALEERDVELGIRHLANDAGTMRFAEAREMDAIRIGIGMYGQYPSDYVRAKRDVELLATFTWKAVVSNVKTVPAGTSISYGRTYIADSERVIATVQCGYADGYPRLLSNKADVLIRGRRARIRGNVCMDQMMVDVTDIPGVKIGDWATLIGTDKDDRIDADELALLARTISYEIMTGIGPRVPRQY